MKNRNYNISFDGQDNDFQFPEIELQYAVSKDEVWKNLSGQLDQPRPDVKRVSLNPFYKMAIAASLILLLGISGFMRFYTKIVYTSA